MGNFRGGRRPRVLVTGAANGIGRIIASAIALHDVDLVIADSDGTRLEVAAQELGACGMFCDTLAMSSVEIFEAQFRDRFGSLHMLVNAAETGHARILSTIRMSAAFLPVLRQTAGSRAIVNVASDHDTDVKLPFDYSCRPEATNHYSAHLQSMVRGSAISVATLVQQGNCTTAEYARILEPLVSRVMTDFTDANDQAPARLEILTENKPRLPGLSSFSLCRLSYPLRRG